MKRSVDLLFSLMALLLLSPLILLLCLLIYISSKGNIFYKQVRVGMHGINFQMYKFRSMYENSEVVTGPVWASNGDKRVTPIGRIMRRFHLDEIPQFVNVLNGQMSIVGPRPERPEIIENIMKDIPSYLSRTTIKPGMTGWAQIRGSYDQSMDDVNIKLKNDFYYINNCSIAFDMKILLLTFMKIIKGKGT